MFNADQARELSDISLKEIQKLADETALDKVLDLVKLHGTYGEKSIIFYNWFPKNMSYNGKRKLYADLEKLGFWFTDDFGDFSGNTIHWGEKPEPFNLFKFIKDLF